MPTTHFAKARGITNWNRLLFWKLKGARGSGMRKKCLVIILLPTLLSACSINHTNQDRLRLLSIEECSEKRAGNSAFSGDKSYQLIRKECEQMLVFDEDYQRMS